MNEPDTIRKIVCVLYDDPVEGYPPKYARDSIPTLAAYPDGQLLPSPSGIDFSPGDLLGCVSGELGLRSFLEDRGHTFVVMSDKDGPDSTTRLCVLELCYGHISRACTENGTSREVTLSVPRSGVKQKIRHFRRWS